MSDEPELIGIDDTFTFSCGPSLSCFNECCRDLNQFLYPYDIVRLKNRLGMRSDVFLDTYTIIYGGDSTGLPVVSFRTRASDGHRCPFVSDAGCTVYDDRPAACRLFPLARAISRSRTTFEIREHYALIEDPVCRGFDGGTPVTVRRFVADQGLLPYNTYNDKMIELISMKQQIMPGYLDTPYREKFILGCYNVDGFRDAVINDALIDPDLIGPDLLEKLRTDDPTVLDLGLAWVTSELFGTPLKP
ncbi:YkgJ family cysteine cluster protein [Desulfatiferula olefinivorans]